MSEAGIAVKGWCPGAWTPMMSGDGLILRVRPRFGRLTARQADGIAAIARRHGSGILEVTNRANLQLRGLSGSALDPALAALADLDLLDPTPELEARRNILLAPFRVPGDATDALAAELHDRLGELPDLPAKFGFAIDAGTAPCFARDPADIRIERARGAALIVRLDGIATGRRVTPSTAIDTLIAAAHWFAETRREGERRMAALVARVTPPAIWTGSPPARPAPPACPGPMAAGFLAGLPFGQIIADDFAAAVTATGAAALRFTPWRMILFEEAHRPPGVPFLGDGTSPLLRVDACPGAPACASATVATRDLARRLAARVAHGDLHVSGCAKGCARRAPARITVVGRDGHFDLVRNGSASDTPTATGLGPADLEQELSRIDAL